MESQISNDVGPQCQPSLDLLADFPNINDSGSIPSNAHYQCSPITSVASLDEPEPGEKPLDDMPANNDSTDAIDVHGLSPNTLNRLSRAAPISPHHFNTFPNTTTSSFPLSTSPPSSLPTKGFALAKRVSKGIFDRLNHNSDYVLSPGQGRIRSLSATSTNSAPVFSSSLMPTSSHPFSSDDEVSFMSKGPLTKQRSLTHRLSEDSLEITLSNSIPSSPGTITDDATSGYETVNNSIGSSSISSDARERIVIPEALQTGMTFLRITHKKKVQRTFRLNPESGIVRWDTKSTAEFEIDRIFEIRTADNAKNYREEFKVSSEHAPRWATIIYYRYPNKLKALHIVAPTQSDFNLFIGVLQKLVKYRQNIMSGLAMPGDKIVDAHWSKYVMKGDDGEERLSFESVEKLSKRLHVNCSRSYLLSKFKEADTDRSGFLNFSEFQQFVKLLKHRKDVVDIFKRIADIRNSNGDLIGMSSHQLKVFFKHTQKTSLTSSQLKKIFDRFSVIDKENNNDEPYLTAETFTDLLWSSYVPLLKTQAEDMTRPLNEYFISSSHNTYLLGRQLAGVSSVEAYVRALQNGCRCLEIDCWDGEFGPRVSHGRTFTSYIEFADVISTILKYAFISSPYPVILSLEVHCNYENQLKMVENLKSILGEHLIVAPFMTHTFSLPCPEDLKHRILIKVKPSREPGKGSSSFSMGQVISSLGGSSASSGGDGSFSSSGSTTSFSDDTGGGANGSGSNSSKSTGSHKQRRPKQSKVCNQLGELGVYLQGIKFRNFSLPESKTVNHIFSFAERTINTLFKDADKLNQIEKHNKKYLMRVYPAGFRVTSSNFDPIPYWRQGIQMVALNWQTNGK